MWFCNETAGGIKIGVFPSQFYGMQNKMFHLIFNIHHSWERWLFQSNKKKCLLLGQWLKISVWRCLVLYHTYYSYVGYVITFYFLE